MSIGPEEVLHAAKLAEIAVADDELPRLACAAEPDRRVRGAAGRGAGRRAGRSPTSAGRQQAAMRPDVVAPIPLAHPVAEMAPEFADGFFLVPRRGAMAEE